ncbi:uncharacterized protein LOC107272586 isoform X4 [Cephus cinctus]|uniref:Uncharacterized protein LOC107272586 isoform X4 n=1 Tax=Cephus cinctus TaxID=211228 RepID=A0AAJ7C9Q4_CEPCN|nr:uncharacterized protein LOC107272586 isoform X4 [Cephus cinctus]
MADDRTTPQGIVASVHALGHASPPPPAPSSAGTKEGTPPRGPRTLLLRRSENGFGFTLRHFIVYPPESCCMLPGHERTRIDEPMDTIFVKQVRAKSPAAEAGLRTGDRVVSVDGAPTRGEQYASVVQRIQQAGPWLRLLVVSKEDDILQRYFGDTAHNPETNQRPRLRSPERTSQKQRRSSSMIPGPSPRSRQSWVCSTSGSENQVTGTESYKQREDVCKDPKMIVSSQRRPLEAHNQDSATLYEKAERNQQRRQQKDLLNATPQPYRPPPDSRFDLYDRTRPESIYSRPSTEQLYDRIKDPIYERVKPDSSNFGKSLDRYPMSRAEPQVPIYRPGRRIVARRASEGSGIVNDIDISGPFGSADALKQSSNPGSRLSMDSSPASKESLSSYDSNSTLTGNECSDDSVIMTRLRKSFEQKEEFLRRPSHPIGWLSPEESARSTAHVQPLIQREFYARPQKLQRQVWPPSEQQQQQHSATLPRQQSPSRSSMERASKSGGKPSNQNVQRVKTDMDSESEYTGNRSSPNELPPSAEEIQAVRDHFYSSLYDCNGQFVKENHFKYGSSTPQFRPANNAPQRNSTSNKAFVTTLSRIHENVTTGQHNQDQHHQSQQAQDLRNGTASLPSSPGPDKKSGEKFPVPPQGLQIVSRRAKQFESGRLLSDDDEPTSDRTSLYKSELSRLSSKRSVPNVAVRKREFESKAECQEPRRIANHRESKSLDAEIPTMETEPVRLRARSNSAESWEAANGSSRRNARHTWQTEQDDSESKRNKAKRQDSYLQAVRTQLEREPQCLRHQDAIDKSTEDEPNAPLFPTTLYDIEADVDSSLSTMGPMPHVRVTPPNCDPYTPPSSPVFDPGSSTSREGPSPQHHRYDCTALPDVETPEDSDELLAPASSSASNGVVLRRQKNAQISDEDRATRRVSYLKATWGERMHVDSDLELSDTEPVHALRSAHRRWRPPLFPSDITPLRRIFEDVTQAASLHRHSHRNSIPGTHGLPCSGGNGSDVVTSKDAEPVEREGSLHVKFTVLDGKRSTDRSWKQVWGVLRGPILHFYKDRHSQSPSTTSDGEAGQNVDVRCSLVDIADDYTKRKHVLRVANPTAEVLLQAEDAASMALWLRALHKHAAAEKPTDIEASTSKQQAVPQTPGPTSTSTAAGQPASQRLSPLPSHKGIRKLTSFRNRSPTGQSPANKTRKPSQTVEPIPSPKTKTWKGRVAKQFRKMHGQAGSPSSPTTQLPPEGATFKIPLEMCPPSSFSEFVPLIVEMCTSIVEARGLEVIGIYRVPGNTAAISQLTESVNKGFENINLQDPRWSDVNVISSLLKSFFRQLPDSLLTADLYPMFIDADKIEDPQRRMATIRKLLRDLPEHHFQTLKYLMFHLKRVVEHSEVNKMEAKNLAIVFGPTLVRASGSRDNMVTMVTDMSHQCRIVESLLNNVDWFFSEEDLDDLSRLSVNLSLPADGNEVEPTSNTNHSLLLNNIQKVEGMRDMVSARDIVSSIISAANRKMQRRRKGHDEPDNDEIDEDKSKSKHSDTGSMAAARQSMALNERQCSVSEIVLMHESKSQQSNQQTSGSGDRSDRSDLSISSAGNYVSPSNGSSSRSKYSTSQSSQSVVVAPSSPESSTHLGNEMGSSNLDSISTISNISNDTKQSNDEVAIRSYAGLSATTQERIRRFEQETKAMLQRDQHRQRREAEKREEEKKRIDMEWQLAKREMENDDILDSIADTTVTPSFFSERLSNLNERLADRSHEPTQDRHARSRSTTRIAPISVAVQKKPTAQQKAQASTQLSNILGEKMNNGIIKKFKTDKEPSLESASLSGARYGSLDSLHEVHAHPHASPSPSRQQRGVPGDISDDAGSCFLHWTQKILTINKKLSRHTATPGFWCYISSHLHGAAGASGTSPKAPTPSPPPTATGPSRSGTSSSSSTSQPTEPGPSGSGAVATSKTLNKFLRGSDLLTSLTSTFDRKWKSLVNPNSQLTSSSESATPRVPDAKTDHDETLLVTVDDQPEPRHFADLYRDPSLHRSAVDTNRIVPRLKDNAPEKDTDCTVVEGTGVGLKTDRARTVTVSSSSTPDNDRNVIRQKDAKSTGSATTSFSGTGADRSTFLDATEKDESDGTKRFESLEKDQDDSATVVSCVSTRTDAESREEKRTGDDGKNSPEVESTSYSNKLEKFESLSQGNPESRSRLKRSESLNKRTESAASKLKRSESLNKHSDRLASPTNGKLKRSESLNKHSERSVSPNSKLKRSESLTKTEKTECNISKRRQSVRKESATKLKRKNGMPERSIKRRHTVGGTKDFDKVHWLDNKLQAEAAERVIKNDNKPKKSQLRTSSPDLSSNRVNVADTSFLIEVSFRGPSNVVFNVTNAQPQSLPDDNLASKVFKVPLESHV